MTSRLVAVCFDANDPLRLARFWAEALRWKVDEEADDVIGLVPTDDTRFRVEFAAVPERKVGKNRIHLDLTTTSLDDQKETVERLVELGARHIDIAPPNDVDQQAEVERLVSLGATRIDIGQGEVDWVVMADPDDNEFCVLSPR
jgi:hypothetical protein